MRLITILTLFVVLSSVADTAQRPVREEAMWIDGSQPPATAAAMVADAEIVLVANYTGKQRLKPDLTPLSTISSLHEFEIVEVIKSTTAPELKSGDVIEIQMFGGITETAKETVHTRVHGEERLIPKRRYVLFLNYLPWRSVGNYVKAWGNPGEGIYELTGNRVRPLSTMRQEHRGQTADGFLAELRKAK